MMEEVLKVIALLVDVGPATAVFIMASLSLLVCGLALFVALQAIKVHRKK